METYSLIWNCYDFEDGLKGGFYENFRWYAIFVYPKGFGRIHKDIELIYIGQAVVQTVSDRLLQNHTALKSALTYYDDRKLGLAFAECTEEIDTSLITDIENILIYIFKPKLNEQGVKKLRIERQLALNSRIDGEQLFPMLEFEKNIKPRHRL